MTRKLLSKKNPSRLGCQTGFDQQRGSVQKFAVCIRLGLPLLVPGLTSATRCLWNCALMGPRAELDELEATVTVSESIMTGSLRHFLGCAACGTYCRHNGVVQALHEIFLPTGDVLLRTHTQCGEQLCWPGTQGNSDRHAEAGVGTPAHRGQNSF